MWLFFFGTAFLVQLAYWVLLQRGFQKAREAARHPADPRSAAPSPPLSVVVAARNEATRLPALLDALARQTHPQFEVIVVDDASTDATARLVRDWSERHPNVRLARVATPRAPRKKHALTRGIQAARHDLLAFTDADCTPPPGWLAALARAHAATPGDAMLIGYSPHRRAPGLLNRLARYETYVTGFFTAAAVGLGRPYMAVGRNLSYPRALFRRIGGFDHSLRSMSGDDDLFVQHVARHAAAPVRHVFGPSSLVPTEAPTTWRAWLRQKRRHASAGRFYAPSVQRHLALFHLTSIALWGAPFLAGWAGLALLAVKLGVQSLVLRAAAPTLDERDHLPAQPFLELLYAGYNLLIAPLGLLRLPKRW